MNNWCLTFVLALATSTLLVKVASAEKESGSCPAASAASSPAADELRSKIDELETKLKETQRETGKLRLKIYEMKKESLKQSEELNSTAKQRTEVAEEKRKCMDELNRAIGRLGSIDRDNRLGRKHAILCEGQKEQIEADLKKVTAELEEAMAGGSCAAKEGTGGGVGGDESLREELTNCEETVKAVRDRCDRDSKDLRRIEKTHERIRKGLEDCTEKTKVCEGEKDHLAFLKRGYDIVVKQMEEETQDAKDKKEKSEASAKEAIKGVSKYKFYLAGIAVLALIGGTIKLYSYVQTKLAERLANLAATRQKDKAEAKRRTPTSLAKQKKKLS